MSSSIRLDLVDSAEFVAPFMFNYEAVENGCVRSFIRYRRQLASKYKQATTAIYHVPNVFLAAS